MDFTKPENGKFAIASEYLLNYLLKYRYNPLYKTSVPYVAMIPELEHDNYGRTDSEKFYLVADEKTCAPSTETLYECIKKYGWEIGTHNVADFLEYATGGYAIWKNGNEPEHQWVKEIRKTLEN
ncbi:MAG: hypothetical protein LBO78_01870, partial [Rickettsiales bacterium]|nr:hypothetical protein [Rickettsiales bacterium]